MLSMLHYDGRCSLRNLVLEPFSASHPGLLACPVADVEKVTWLLGETFDPKGFSFSPLVTPPAEASEGVWSRVLEMGPRLTFTSPWSTNAVSILRAAGIPILRLERYRRLCFLTNVALEEAEVALLAASLHDRMTEMVLDRSLDTFDTGAAPEAWYEVPVLEKGAAAIAAENAASGLGLDDWDVAYYTELFRERLQRNPTNVELFDISQSNSEHSRHWFFKARMVIDGKEQPETLMDVVGATLKASPGNSIVAFADNSSAIQGFTGLHFMPSAVQATDVAVGPAPFSAQQRTRHLLLTAETHNFPCGVAPLPGAETGAGGRIRDTHATGTGSLVAAGTAGYCVGNLHIPGYVLPWEQAASDFAYPPNFAQPLTIAVQASNGASDYGNKFGEPLIAGFMRSFGMRQASGRRREWVKPIMFSAGIGFLDAAHAVKGKPEPGMLITKVGGPAYRIGIGGSAASSMVQGDNRAELDFDAVQRGDAEMESKMNRVIRACVELGEGNPIVSIHDQGAGGNCNVLKEICEPLGGRIHIRALPCGDPTMSVLELWGSEYQENNALLLRPADAPLFTALCERERVPHAFVGTVSSDGQVQVIDDVDGTKPVDMDIEAVLGGMPQKTFSFSRTPRALLPFEPPPGTTVATALNRVLRLLAVGSKRFLTNKVDRSVTGLVAQQQCVGPLHTPLADCAVVASSFFSQTGVASSIGEAPLKGLVSNAAQARMTVAEAVTNLMGAPITKLADAKCSGNWMWAAKLDGEGADLWDTAIAMRDAMLELGLAVDGGKDSLSMAAKAPDGEVVKAPGQLVLSLYAPCTDITRVVTPDIKAAGSSSLLLLDCSRAPGSEAAPQARLGGSALAQVYGQIGAEAPDLSNPSHLGLMFAAVNTLVKRGEAALATPFSLAEYTDQQAADVAPWADGETGAAFSTGPAQEPVILALHDRSDGGLLVALLEMAFAGACGLEVDLPCPPGSSALGECFAEEVGVVIEVHNDMLARVQTWLAEAGVHSACVGTTTVGAGLRVSVGGETVLSTQTAAQSCPSTDSALSTCEDDALLRAFSLNQWRDVWECTSFQLERRQSNPACVEQEQAALSKPRETSLSLSFTPTPTPQHWLGDSRPSVMVLREEGTNGDRELAAAFHMAGFETWDVSMSDLLAGRITLDRFSGIAAAGGFSYADVLDSAKGWAGSIKFSASLSAQFQRFVNERQDTFSLGICNGCQLFALLGIVPFPSEALPGAQQPRFVHNRSGRYESRFVAVQIQEDSKAIMLQGMQGSRLGVWVAHGEGRAFFPDTDVVDRVLEQGLAPLRYVAGDDTEPAEGYPANPNGSPHGIAALCSPDGRHLAMMPHPERASHLWQWPHLPAVWARGPDALRASPWLKMFQNAREWVQAHKAAQ